MRLWIILVSLVVLFIYVLFGLMIHILTNFKHANIYDDADVTYDEGRPEWVPEDAFVLDFHTHTRASDGLLTPRQLILWHVSNGYNGMVISDHNSMDAVDETLKIAAEEFPDFVVIPGFELTSLKTHLNIIGCKKLTTLTNPIWTRKKTIIKAIKEAHEQDALVQFNHRDWYFHSRYEPMEFYLENDIDGWEIYNGFKFTDKEAPDFIEKHKDKKIMFASAGTDVHDPAKHHRVYTEILSDDHSIEGILSALRVGKTKVYYNEEAENNRVPPEKGKLKINPKRTDYIKRWLWLYWIGDAILMGKRQKLFYIFVFIVIALSIISAIML